MASFKNTVSRALKEVERTLGANTFLLLDAARQPNSAPIPCIPNSLMNGVTIEVGGNPVEIALTLFVRFDLFLTPDNTLTPIDGQLYTLTDGPAVPVAGQLLQFRGNPYRVLTAKQSACLSHYELHLADPDSGR